MKETNSILKDIREALGLGSDDTSFDTELKMHINTCISQLNQNGVGRNVVVFDDTLKWSDLLDPTQIEGNKHAKLIPLFIMLSTKRIFDPPPPSTIEYYSKSIDDMLWRLKLAYEQPQDSGGGDVK